MQVTGIKGHLDADSDETPAENDDLIDAAKRGDVAGVQAQHGSARVGRSARMTPGSKTDALACCACFLTAGGLAEEGVRVVPRWVRASLDTARHIGSLHAARRMLCCTCRARSWGLTALHYAANNGCRNTVRALLKRQADVNIVDAKHGCSTHLTTLHVACSAHPYNVCLSNLQRCRWHPACIRRTAHVCWCAHEYSRTLVGSCTGVDVVRRTLWRGSSELTNGQHCRAREC